MNTEKEEVADFASMFGGGYAKTDRTEQRLRAERRASMTEKQRHRKGGAMRTAQLNFRCSPAFKKLASGLAKHRDCSIADMMEDAVAMLAKDSNYKVGDA